MTLITTLLSYSINTSHSIIRNIILPYKLSQLMLLLFYPQSIIWLITFPSSQYRFVCLFFLLLPSTGPKANVIILDYFNLIWYNYKSLHILNFCFWSKIHPVPIFVLVIFDSLCCVTAIPKSQWPKIAQVYFPLLSHGFCEMAVPLL